MRTSSRRLGWALAFSVSLTCHAAAVLAMMASQNLYGLSRAPSPSISVEAVQTVVVEALTPTENVEPPTQSAAQRESVEAPEPSEQHVAAAAPEPTPIESAPQVAEPPPPVAPPVTPPRVVPPPQPPVVDNSAEPVATASLAPALVTAEQPDAPEMQVSPEIQIAAFDDARRAEEQRTTEDEVRGKLAEEMQSRQREAVERARKLKAETERRLKERKARELAERKARDAERERKRRAELKAAEERKARGTEQSRRASVASRGKAAERSGSGRTSASRGDILSYAAMVRARVASNRPGGSGQSGTVVISFGVSGGGGISFVRISRSSGNPGLDRAAMAAVRGAGSFPPPPDRGSHSFSIPFHFN